MTPEPNDVCVSIGDVTEGGEYSAPNGGPGPSLNCADIVKKVDEKTRSRTSINALLRDRARRHELTRRH